MNEFILKVNIQDVKELAQGLIIPDISDAEASDILALTSKDSGIVKAFEQGIMNAIYKYSRMSK